MGIKFRQNLQLMVFLHSLHHRIHDVALPRVGLLLFSLDDKRNDLCFIHDRTVQSQYVLFNNSLILLFELDDFAGIKLVLVVLAFFIDLIDEPRILKHLAIEYLLVVCPKRANIIGEVGKKERSDFSRPFVLGVAYERLKQLSKHIFGNPLGVGLQFLIVDEGARVDGINLFDLL